MLSRISGWLRTPEPGLQRGFLVATALAVVIACLAGVVRYRAMQTLPMDWDELVYLRLGYVYATIIERGDWEQVPRVPFNREHPPLVKLAYGVRLAGEDRDPPIKPQPSGTPIPMELREEFQQARMLSVAAGTAQVYLVALLNPLAGLFLAVDSYHIRYTSEILLEAMPGFFAVFAVVLFGAAWRPTSHPKDPLRAGWLAASAVCLGLAVAGKYTYGLVALAIFPVLLARSIRLRSVALYVALALAVFFAANPWLWSDPWGAISQTASFHAAYSSDHARPWWHLLGLLSHFTYDDHHGEFFVAWPDQLLVVFAIVGLWRTLKRRPTWALWALLGIVFLITWPTKWAHYPLLALPAFAMCAAYGVSACAEGLRTLWQRRGHRPGAPAS